MVDPPEGMVFARQIVRICSICVRICDGLSVVLSVYLILDITILHQPLSAHEHTSTNKQTTQLLQQVHNACATQAILGILLNNDEVQLGEMLTDFRGFGAGLDSESMGTCVWC